MIVALEDNKVLMVRQFRFSIQRDTLEFPAGFVDEGEQPLEAAKRELLEETGYTAKEWASLGGITDAVGVARRQGYVFLARNLTRTDEELVNEDGIKDYCWVHADDLRRKIEIGELIDAKVIAALYKAQLYFGS